VGESTSLARLQVLAAREELDEELVRLEASARAAVDVPAKIRRHPVKAAGLAAGTGFVVLGGPRRVLRGARHAIFGRPAPLPKSMLPKEIDASLRSLGEDGDKVRGLLEHEFASYLQATEPARKRRDLSGALAVATIAFIRPLVLRHSKRLAGEIFATDGKAYSERLDAVRAALGGDKVGDGGKSPVGAEAAVGGKSPVVDQGQKPA
jgi:hypothetical protein